MDSDVEQMAHNCNECTSNLKSPAKSPLHPWEWPSQPWFRIHLDYAGPFMGKMFLIIVDAHSKWIDVHPTNSSTSEITIEKLRITFANLGLPHQIVTDNGSCFTSTEFKNFTTANGIKHIFTAPYHASSNGLAERAVQSFKQSMRKQTGGTVQMKVSRFLFQYRTTPHSATGVSPAELLLNRKLRNHLDLLRPDLATKVLQKQSCQKDAYDRHAKYREIHENDKVLVKDFTSRNQYGFQALSLRRQVLCQQKFNYKMDRAVLAATKIIFTAGTRNLQIHLNRKKQIHQFHQQMEKVI